MFGIVNLEGNCLKKMNFCKQRQNSNNEQTKNEQKIENKMIEDRGVERTF